MKVPLSDALANKIITMHAQGFDCGPLVNFIGNLYNNPSPTAIAELYLFIEACNLPITEDGCFIAYKMVKENYMDIYSGTMRNSIGDIPAMPRGLVDDNRNNTCSAGLHFCSKEYLPKFGSGRRDTDRCMLVKINPANVVSIPSDYNNSKGRAWAYEVVSEVAAGWRETLPTEDYTDRAVVSATGAELPVAPAYAERLNNVLNCQVPDEEDGYSADFVTGYGTGYTHGRNKINAIALPASEYERGYTQGHKDGRGKRAKLIK
jgi:hypothetical protein